METMEEPWIAFKVLAAGALERPIAFPMNDRPGVMLAGAVRAYLNRWGVAPGKAVTLFCNNDDAHRTARDLVAAGYIIYGSSTMLVYTAGQGVHGFTLVPSIGEFLLSHENIATPFKGKIYSVNEAYEPKWSPAVREVLRQLKYGRDAKKTTRKK